MALSQNTITIQTDFTKLYQSGYYFLPFLSKFIKFP